MLDPTTQRRSPTLEGKVSCTNCNATMTLADGKYSCATPIDGMCAWPRYDAHLVRAVIRCLVDRLTTEDTLAGVAAKVGKTLEPQVSVQTERLLVSETEIARLEEEKNRIFGEVESGTRAFSEITDEVSEIYSAQAEPEHESMLAREELDRLEFIAKPDGIRETATDLGTYLESPEPELVQELIDLLVEEVCITSEEPWVKFYRPVPGQPDPYGYNYEGLMSWMI